MLGKEVFKGGIKELQIAFKTFRLSEEEIRLWYEYTKHLSDFEYKEKIRNCIMLCKKNPTIADLLNLSKFENDTRANAGAYKEIK